MEDGVVKSFLNKFSYFYLWKFIDLFYLLILVRIIGISKFGIIFLTLLIVKLSLLIFKAKLPVDDSKKIKDYCNTLSIIYPMVGIISGIILFLLSYRYSSLEITLKMASLIPIFYGFGATAELFYHARGYEKRLYKNYTILSLLLASFNVLGYILYGSYEIIIVGYVLYQILIMLDLLNKFPFKIQYKINKKILRNIINDSIYNFKQNIFLIIEYGILISIGLFVSIEAFTYVYVAYILSMFLYKNFTLILSEFISHRMNDMSFEVFRFNFIRIMEYMSIILIPYFLIFMALSYDFSVIGINIIDFSPIFNVFLLTGLIKSISEITRIVFYTESKSKIISRLKYIETISLIFLTIILFKLFGLYGIALAYLVTSILISTLFILIAHGFTRVDILTASKDSFYVLFCGILTALLLGLLKEWFAANSLFSLIILFTIGVTIYIGLTLLFNFELYKRFIKFIFEWAQQ